jgi:hypothetical protein
MTAKRHFAEGLMTHPEAESAKLWKKGKMRGEFR